jgi:hypothetical protein
MEISVQDWLTLLLWACDGVSRWEHAIGPHVVSQDVKRDRKRLGSHSSLWGYAPVTPRPPARPHNLKALPPPSSIIWGDKSLTHEPLTDSSDPNYSKNLWRIPRWWHQKNKANIWPSKSGACPTAQLHGHKPSPGERSIVHWQTLNM